MNYKKIKKAAIELSKKKESEKNNFLECLSHTLLVNKRKVLEANQKDLERAKKDNFSPAFLERLTLNEYGLTEMVEKVYEMQRLTSGIGEIIEERITKEKLKLQKIRVPIGVIAIIYEARPEVTIDVTSLCIKSGNVAILKGGSEAIETNKILFLCIKLALQKAFFLIDSVTFIASRNRTTIEKLLKQNNVIDLVIARGSYQMVKNIQSSSSIPVLAHSAGGARIYIDKSADISIIKNILINAKTTKPSACNSLDTIVLHKSLESLLPQIIKTLKKHNVEIINNKWSKEFLDLRVSIKIVNNEDEAIEFVNNYSKKHSEGLIAEDKNLIDKFVNSIDAAVLFINSSPRLNDGYVFGLGSEMGIATGKLHARGPVGLKELTIYKWIAYGKGHIRE